MSKSPVKHLLIIIIFFAAISLLMPPPTPAQTYTVKQEDSLFLIGQKFGVSSAKLQRANNLQSTTIYPGQKLWIPQNSLYTVKKGDTLFIIANRYRTTVEKLKSINGLSSHIIYPGQKLHVPVVRRNLSSRGYGDISRDDFKLLARIVHGEARGEPYQGQVAVAAVVLNRMESPLFPDTVRGVVFQSKAFTAVLDGQIWLEPNQAAYNAVRDALNGWDPTNGALYYWNPVTSTSRWIWSRQITGKIGQHIFGI